MLRLISRSVFPWLLVVSCSPGVHHATTLAEHEQLARHYEATASSIELECYKARRHELTVDDPAYCWKAHDIRFRDANLNAATAHRAAAAELRAAEARTFRTATR